MILARLYQNGLIDGNLGGDMKERGLDEAPVRSCLRRDDKDVIEDTGRHPKCEVDVERIVKSEWADSEFLEEGTHGRLLFFCVKAR